MRPEERIMARKEIQSSRAYAGPVLWVFLLIACYWILAEWPDLPRLLAAVRADLQWPG